MTAATTPWALAERALTLLAVDPAGLGGLWVVARAGPVRDTLCAGIATVPMAHRRLHPAIADDALFGGLDLSATLAQGHMVRSRGVLNDPALLTLTMAERCPPGLGARLCQALDANIGHALVALDEAAEEGEGLLNGLADRLAFRVDLGALGFHAAPGFAVDAAEVAEAQQALPRVAVPADLITQLAALALQFGIDSLRGPLFALRAARANAAVHQRTTVAEDDLALAAQLVFAHRATRIPEDTAQDDAPPEPDRADADDGAAQPALPNIPDEILLEAVRAILPDGLLRDIAGGTPGRMARGAAGAGMRHKGNRRGRPLPPRPGKLHSGARVDLPATLRAAAPWQTIRRRATLREQPLYIRAADIRLKQFEEKSDRLLVFAVDASGSAALARLAEAKGAIELLLAEAYARRDHVALIAFRGAQAELLLPPTRSLVQTKRRLAGLPGGGGTPLASGLKAALDLSLTARGRGMTPTVAVLTDGRANIALDGSAGRARAAEDAGTIGAALRAHGIPSVIIDTSRRPHPDLSRLAQTMAARYAPLPRADAHTLSNVIAAELEH